MVTCLMKITTNTTAQIVTMALVILHILHAKQMFFQICKI